MPTLHYPARFTSETYADYSQRRKTSKLVINSYLKGKVIWDSTIKGTFQYKKPLV